MPSPTRIRLFNFRLLAVLVVFAGLASGCQSSRPSFSFQPIVLRAGQPGLRVAVARPNASDAPAAAPATASAALAPVAPVAPVVEAAASQPVIGTSADSQVPASSQPQTGQPQLLAATSAQSITPTAAGQNRALAPHRRLLPHRAQAPARQGLGLTVLGLLGMVALVVALVGLAISGGGAGWIIAAAIAAGVVLLAYLDPGGH